MSGTGGGGPSALALTLEEKRQRLISQAKARGGWTHEEVMVNLTRRIAAAVETCAAAAARVAGAAVGGARRTRKHVNRRTKSRKSQK